MGVLIPKSEKIPIQKRKRRHIRYEEPYRINNNIRASQVRVVGEGIEPSIYPIATAIEMAKNQGLDLVEVSNNVTLPVCKIIDYAKFKYEQKKKQKFLKAKAHKVVVKEIRFRPTTGEHDFEVKKKHVINFLKEGAKVKTSVFFRGREIAFKENGRRLLEKLKEAIEPYGKIEHPLKMEGKNMVLMVVPKTSNKN